MGKQDYCQSHQPISLKLGLVIGPTSQMNWLTSAGDLVSDTSVTIAELADSRKFISISHAVTGRI